MQLAVGTATGIGEYALGAARALSERGVVEVVPLRAAWLDPWRFDRRVLWDQVLLPLAATRERLDLVHCTSGTLPLLLGIARRSAAGVRRVPRVVTVHDVAWLRAQAHARAYARFYFGRLQLAAYRRADRIVVDSAFSREELLALGGVDAARVDVVAPGVAADLIALDRRVPLASADAAEPPIVLAVGTVERRKNLEVVIRALAGSEATLVSAGPATPYRRECEELARACGTRVDFRGYVSRTELLDLYARAAVAVVPSRYEGFGYGAAQALCAGVPLLAARTSSLPEVVRDDADLLRVDDAPQWRASLDAVLARPLDAERRARGVRAAAAERFGWAASAAALEAVYAATLHDARSVTSEAQ